MSTSQRPRDDLATPAAAPVAPSSRRSALAKVGDYMRLLGGLMRDRRVSLLDRALVIGSIAYVISPLDFIPDVIPFVGELDDVVMVMMALTRLFERAPLQAIRAHWRGAPGDLASGWLRRVAWVVSFLFPAATRRRLQRFGRGGLPTE